MSQKRGREAEASTSTAAKKLKETPCASSVQDAMLNLIKTHEKAPTTLIQQLAHLLSQQAVLVINDKIYCRLAEIEFYYTNVVSSNNSSSSKEEHHDDPFSHCHPLQLLMAQWYFHRSSSSATANYKAGSYKGLDVTFGYSKDEEEEQQENGKESSSTSGGDEKKKAKVVKRDIYGGVLIRALLCYRHAAEADSDDEDDDKKTKKKNKVLPLEFIEGPCNVVDYILKQNGNVDSIHELVQNHMSNDLKIDSNSNVLCLKLRSQIENKQVLSQLFPEKDEWGQMYASPRVGLTLKKKEKLEDRKLYIMKPYRFVIAPSKMKKCKHTMVCAQFFYEYYEPSDDKANFKLSSAEKKKLASQFSVTEKALTGYIQDFLKGGALSAEQVEKKFVGAKMNTSELCQLMGACLIPK